MLTGVLPWSQRNQAQLLDQIRKADFTIPPGVSDAAKDLIRRFMDPNPATRITIDEALANPWVKTAPTHSFCTAEPALLLSLKCVDHFFGRDSSEVEIEDQTFERSYTVRTGTVENELRVIAPEPKGSTARQTAKRLIFHQRVTSGARKKR
jgi:serine/threonine protein kinase